MTTTQPTLVAFHGQPAIKDEYLARVEAHRAADDFTRDRYGRASGPDQQGQGRWHGGVSGCTFRAEDDPRVAGEAQIGLPADLTWLLDTLFVEMSLARYAAWPGQFLQAIPVGADLAGVWPGLAVWLLTDAQAGMMPLARTADQREAIEAVANLYSRGLDGTTVPYEQWVAVREVVSTANRAASEVSRQAANVSFHARSCTNYAEADSAEVAAAAMGVASGAAFFQSTCVTTAAFAAGRAASAAVYVERVYDANVMGAMMTAATICLAATAAYADGVADQLLALLAAAPVPVRQASRKRPSRTVAPPALVAFHGQQVIKDGYLTRMEAHRTAGDLIRDRFYGRTIGDAYYGQSIEPGRQGRARGWRGGASGCAFRNNHDAHHEGELLIGLPRPLGRLLDAVFMGVSPARYAAWPGQFLQAIPVGADLAGVWSQLAGGLLTDGPASILAIARTDEQRAAIQAVADLYAKVRAGRKVSVKAWLAAYQVATAAASAGATTYADAPAYTAYVAAGYAVLAAAYAAVAAAGITGAYNVSGAVANAHASALAYAATATAHVAAARAFPTRYVPDTAAYDAASDAYYEGVADQLLTLLAAAPVIVLKGDKQLPTRARTRR